VWLTSLGVFTVGSLLCGLAWSAESLIAFRVLQGLGGGMLIPLIQMVLAAAAGPARVGRVMAVVGVPAMLGPVLGPVLGGLIVSDAGWRLIFFINIPVCLAAVVATRAVVMPDLRRAAAARLDVAGLALLSPALVAIVYGLSQAGTNGSFGDAAVLAPIVAGLGLLAGFALHALRTRGEPLIDVRLFRERSFASYSGVVFFVSMAMLGTALLLPLYYQQVRGEDALHAGLLLAPQGLGMGIALMVAGKLSDRLNPRPIILAGLALTATATAIYTQIGAHTSVALLSVAALIAGAGIGAALVPAMTGVYKDLSGDAVPRATSSIRIFQQLGGSFGIAILAVILQQQAAAAVDLAQSFGHTFWWALAFIAIAFVPTLLLPPAVVERDQPSASRAARAGR
jgi:EmrB/QacA subfamily drug resistance transporter